MGREETEANREEMLASLRRLLAEPSWRRLYASGSNSGLFPSPTPRTRRLGERLVKLGYLEIEHSGESVGANRATRVRITEAGRDWVLETDDPRLLLEDLLHATDRVCDRLGALERDWHCERERLARQRADVAAVLQRLSTPTPGPGLEEAVLRSLRVHAASGDPADCTMAELFAAIRESRPDATIGRFHDTIRRLHETGSLRLAPWTGPLYQLREPALALLIGHEVLYYVHLARSHAA